MVVNNVVTSNIATNSADVEAKVFARLVELDLTPKHKVAVAFSGGGDSTALLALMLKWSESGHVFALIVDHALRKNSRNEAKLAEKRALAMGAQTEILTCKWSNAIPITGIQEKARNARYKLLGDACRNLGMPHLLLGHNQDDQAETVLMRKQSGSGWRGLAGMREHSIAPIWPALYGVTTLRPMLSCGRHELRNYNQKSGLKWIDDPSNENRSFARIRARAHLATHENEKQSLLLTAKAASEILALEKAETARFIKGNTELHDWGGMTVLPTFHNAKLGQGAEALKYLLPAISGQALPPAYDKRMNLARRLRSSEFGGATLGGVQFVPGEYGILCVRDLGGILGRHGVGALEAVHLKENQTQIWDGRFFVSAAQNGSRVDVLANHVETLGAHQKISLSKMPEPARAGLPVFITDERISYSPYVDSPAHQQAFTATSLTAVRLHALLSE